MKPFILAFLLCACFSIGGHAEPQKNELPPEVVAALRDPDKSVLYSLEPWEQPAPSDETLHRFKVLGHTELDRVQATAAAHEFRTAVSTWDGAIAMCFDPRHALQITTGNKTYELLLCYRCNQLYVYQGDKLVTTLGATGSPTVLNVLLAAAKVPLSITDSDEDRLARQKKAEVAKGHWLATMPDCLRPLWERAVQNEFSPDLNVLRGALAEGYPSNSKRILALFTWFGSGDGPWSGYPMYEDVAENLLFDFPTSDLRTVAEANGLDEPQLEGAARLFGGWDFSKRRPGDLRTLTPDLKKKLLDHSLKSTDEDKRDRARKAFES